MASPSLARSPPDRCRALVGGLAGSPNDPSRARRSVSRHENGVVDVVEDRRAGVDLLVLLGEVARWHVGPELDLAGGRHLHPGQAPQQARLAGTVAARRPPGGPPGRRWNADRLQRGEAAVAHAEAVHAQGHLPEPPGFGQAEGRGRSPPVDRGAGGLEALDALVEGLGDPGPAVGAAPHGVGQGGQPGDLAALEGGRPLALGLVRRQLRPVAGVVALVLVRGRRRPGGGPW